MKHILHVSAVLLPTLLIAACASPAPVVQNDQASGIDLTRYRTYMWAEEPQTQSPIVRDKLIRAVDAQLSAKGWQRKVDGEVALVGHLVTREDVSYDHFSLGVGLGGWGSNSGGGIGTSTGTSKPTTKVVGSLIFELYDAKTKQAIWRATVSGDVPQTPETIDAAIAKYIPEMFQSLPPSQGR